MTKETPKSSDLIGREQSFELYTFHYTVMYIVRDIV